jgi:signal transduction histidine kinase
MIRSRGRQLLFLFWVAPAIVAAYGMEVVSVRYNPELTFIEKLGANLLMWMSWGVVALGVFAVLDRVPMDRERWRRSLALMFPMSALVVFLQILLMAWITDLYGLGPSYHFESMIAIGIRSYGDVFFVTFWGIVGAHTALRWNDAWHAQTVLAERLRADLTTAQLSALRAQLNPHFLFNALNSVVTLIDREPADAQRMVVRLADLLRSTLALSSEQEVSVRREVELVARYLEIEQIRFHDRLGIRWDIDEIARDAAVPALALQPLVENAIVHGTSRVTGNGCISISATVNGSALVISVRDNGPGLDRGGGRRGAGIGVKNLRERLARLYGDAAALTLENAPDGGAVATLSLPFRATAGEALPAAPVS